jgi:hypothetical protein
MEGDGGKAAGAGREAGEDGDRREGWEKGGEDWMTGCAWAGCVIEWSRPSVLPRPLHRSSWKGRPSMEMLQDEKADVRMRMATFEGVLHKRHF